MTLPARRFGKLGALSIALALTSLTSSRAFAQQAPAGTSSERPWPENPAKEADPPLIPPPGQDRLPTSTSGTELVPPDRERANTVVVGTTDTGSPDVRDARIKALEERLAEDEARLNRLDVGQRILKHLTFSGYVQPQLIIQVNNTAASSNLINGVLPPGISANAVIANPDGTTTNNDYFRLRRTRFRTVFQTDVARFSLEVDPFPLGANNIVIGTIVRDAEATGIAHWSRDVRTEFSAGIFLLPLRLELFERSNVRPFIERSWLVQSLFPSGRDIGAHARTYAFDQKLLVDVGVVNGQRLDQPDLIRLPDLNQAKDYYGVVKYRLGKVNLTTTGYVGTGQIVDTQLLRVKNYGRWMLNYGLGAHHVFLRRLGETLVSTELTFMQNMDIGTAYPFAVPSIPTPFSDNVANLMERGFYVRVEQEITPLALVGYRFDTYTPDSSIKNNARDTHAVVAVLRFSKNLRWMNEVDVVIDNAHPEGSPPPSKHTFIYSSVLQAGF
ncbi:hypothetical protein [Labilithrix luteola]|nr:hypothetical protein [Labilithrix luteola]